MTTRKDVESAISDLERDGFKVERGKKGTPTLVAPNGSRYRPGRDFKALRAWAAKQNGAPRKTQAREHGGELLVRDRTARHSRLLEGTLSHWDRLPKEQKLEGVREMLHRLGKDGEERAFAALHLLGG